MKAWLRAHASELAEAQVQSSAQIVSFKTVPVAAAVAWMATLAKWRARVEIECRWHAVRTRVACLRGACSESSGIRDAVGVRASPTHRARRLRWSTSAADLPTRTALSRIRRRPSSGTVACATTSADRSRESWLKTSIATLASLQLTGPPPKNAEVRKNLASRCVRCEVEGQAL